MREYFGLSLGDLSPVTPVPQGHLLLVLKSYFDGGNQADNPEYSHACLATASGSERQWRRFTADWNKALYARGAKFLHTTDAVSLKNEFAVENGWSKESVDALIRDCVKVIGNHIEIPPGFPGRKPRAGLYLMTFMIPTADWLKARQECPTLPNTVSEICVSESLGFVFKRGSRLGAKAFQLFFDRGEPFHGHIQDRYLSSKSRQSMPLLESIIHLGESDMRDVPALQMADLFAWCINHNHVVVRDWHASLHALPWNSIYLDYPLLLKPSPNAIEMTRSWNLPQRQSTESRIAKLSRKRGVPIEVPPIPENLIPRKRSKFGQ